MKEVTDLSATTQDSVQSRLVRELLIASEHTVERFRKRLKQEDLSVAEFDVIRALGNSDGLRMKEVARALGASSSASNATRVCIMLEKRGLVRRQRADDNDREVIARLTEAGKRKFDACFAPIRTFTDQFVDTALTAAEQEQLLVLLKRYVHGI